MQQSIYGWRGAQPSKNFKRFYDLFPQAYTQGVFLNYRSTPAIVNVANAIMGTQMRSGRPCKSPLLPSLTNYSSSEMEAVGVVKSIANATMSKRLSLNEVAILVRAHFLTRIFEEQLTKYHIPYRIVG
jgi:DNA helicase-2/ATP-dependent DNA helicase PcrA